MNVGPMTQNVISGFIDECNKEETQENIKYKIIDPLIDHIATKLQPYVLVIICVFTIFFILMIWILMIIIKTNSSDIKYKVTI